MNFGIERPWIFLSLPLVFAALVFTLKRYKLLEKTLTERNAVQKGSTQFGRLKRCFYARTYCRLASVLFAVAAAAGISWGLNVVPVQRSGRSVSMVFDISYSMETPDAPGGMTRLKAAADYAEKLIEKLDGTKISVVLAKGDGVIALPLTEDMQAVVTLLENLSPQLMTAAGTSLGSGIKAAVTSFPAQSSDANFVWLFTDGDETDGTLSSALFECAEYGIPVTIIGFGSERESEILAGDGKTRVRTALRSASLEKTLEVAKRKISGGKHLDEIPAMEYIDASEMSSAWKLLDSLSLENRNAVVSYEVQRVERSSLFILLSVLLFVASVIAGEFDVKFSRLKVASVVALCFMLTGCSERFNDGLLILKGKIAWNGKNYQQAVADFLTAAENASERKDDLVYNHAVCNLATTYLMQDENSAAMARFSMISDSAPDNVKFSVYYNSGIIEHRNGNYKKASDYFRKALEIDSTSTDAKINLELSLKEDVSQPAENVQNMVPVSENSREQTLENELYSIIKENEQRQWKNQQQNSESSSADY